MKPAMLYVHFPFCARRCGYCDFAAQSVRRAPARAWLDAIAAELELVVRQEGWPVPLELETIYVGGGTPSLGGPGLMAGLGRRLRRSAVWSEETVEWTAEANPESFDAALAGAWREAGVNRLSFGVQSLDDATLSWLGRGHDAATAVSALRVARAAGFDDVGIDLIYGLPARLGRRWADDMERALRLEPVHVSLYALTAEPGTLLGRSVSAGEEILADGDACAEEYLLAAELLEAAGYWHYEVSSFCRGGRRARHNSAYWSGLAYLGLGPGAHSYLPPRRWWNTADWGEYRAAVQNGALARSGVERVAGGVAELERRWLALRTDEGLDPICLGPAAMEIVERWRVAGLAREGVPIRLTARGWLVLDRLVLDLDGIGDGGRTGGLARQGAG